MLVKTEGTLSFVHACLWAKKTWPHDAQEIVRHMMACFGLYFQVIIFDQFLLLLLDMFISIVFKNTESDLDFKALYGIITLPKWWFSNRKDCCFEGPIFHNKGNVFERFNNVKDTDSLLKSVNPSSLIVIIAISSFGFHSCARATPDRGFRGLLESHLCNNSPWEMLVASWIFCVSVV